MNFDLRYYEGLVDVVTDNTGGAVTNRTLSFIVGFPLGGPKDVPVD
jgi:hypothetical protein